MKFNYLKHLLRKISVEVTMPLEKEIMDNNVIQMKSLLYEIYFKLSNKDIQLFEIENELVYKGDIRTDIENINKRLLMASGDCCHILNALRDLDQSNGDNNEKIHKKRKKILQLLKQEQEANAIKIRIQTAKELTREERLIKIAEMNVDTKPCDCLDSIAPILLRINKDITNFEIKNNEIVKSYNYKELLEMEEAAKEMEPTEPNIKDAYKYVDEIKAKMSETRKRIEIERINAANKQNEMSQKTSQSTAINAKYKKKPMSLRKEKTKKGEKIEKVVENVVPEVKKPEALSINKKKFGNQPLTQREKEELKSLKLKNSQEKKFLSEQIQLFKLHRQLYRRTLCQEILEDKRTYDSVINGCLDIAFHKKQYEEKYQIPLPDDIFKEWKQLVIYGVTIKSVPFNLPTDFCDCHKTYLEIKTMVRNNELSCHRELRDYLNFENKWQNNTKEPELPTISHVVFSLLGEKYPKTLNEIKVTRELKCKTIFIFDVVEHRDKFIESLKALTEIHKIAIITMADVVDFCIQFYITERINKLEDDLYDFDDKYTVKSVPMTPVSKPSKIGKGKQKPVVPEVLTGNIDVDTQTPLCIPDYYQFSSCGAIGKQARIYLAEEQPLDNEMLLNMLVEYINNNPDINGFVLLDYPQEESDIVQFEKVFTSMAPDIYNIGKPHDPRKSKLLPNNEENEQFETYLTNFIKMEQIKNNNYNDLSDVENCIDNFYKEQGVFSSIKYNELTVELTKYIARLIIGDFTMPRKPSDVLFDVTITEKVVRLDDESLINVFIQRKSKAENKTKVKGKGKGKESKKSAVVVEVIPDNEIGVQTNEMDLYRCCEQCEEADKIREQWYNNESEIEIIPYVSTNNVAKDILDQMAEYWINLEATYLYNIKSVSLSIYKIFTFNLKHCLILGDKRKIGFH